MDIKKRLKNKTFWVALIPAILLVIQSVLAVFNVTVDFAWLSDKLLEVVNTVFTLLVVLGVVVDPTTKGIMDNK